MLSLIAAAVMAATTDRADLLGRAAAEFEIALRHNDVPVLEQLLSSDWLIIESNGRAISRERFLAALRSGELSHSEMLSSDAQVRIYGDAAIQMARADGHGTYRGKPFQFSERSTDVWHWSDGRWICTFTQVTKIAPAAK